MTVLEYDPDAPMAQEYRELARKIDENKMMNIPTPIEMDDLEQLLVDFGMAEADGGDGVVRTKAQELALACI
jgi:nitrogenase iron protein NifH